MTDDTKYTDAFNLMRNLGETGGRLADFIRQYGAELAAVQLRVDGKALKRMLESMQSLGGLAITLKEVELRRGATRLAMNKPQAENFMLLVAVLRARLGTAGLARRIGVTRQSIYAMTSSGGPHTTTPMVMSICSLLGYTGLLPFMEYLATGVPSVSHVPVKVLGT